MSGVFEPFASGKGTLVMRRRQHRVLLWRVFCFCARYRCALRYFDEDRFEIVAKRDIAENEELRHVYRTDTARLVRSGQPSW